MQEEVTENDDQVNEEMMEEEQSVPFRLMQDRLTQQVQHIRWCATMDLLAICYAQNNQTHIYRPSNFQRLHCIQPSQLSNSGSNLTITDLCWSFDGQMLAISSSSVISDQSTLSVIDLLDVESGKIVFSTPVTQREYQKLAWITHSQFVDLTHQSRSVNVTTQALPLLTLPDPTSIINAFCETKLDVRHHPLLRPLSAFNVLMALTKCSSLEFYAMGTMSLASIDLSSLLMFGERLTNFSLSNNFEKLILFKENEEGLSSMCSVDISSMFNGRNCELIIDEWSHYINSFDILCRDIECVTSSPDVPYSTSRISQCLYYLKTQWDQFYSKSFLPIFEDLKDKIMNESLLSTAPNLTHIFTSMLSTGVIDHATFHWLGTTTDEQLTKVIRLLQQTHKIMCLYLTDHLHRYLEHLILRFSSLSAQFNSQLLSQSNSLFSLTQKLISQISESVKSIDNFLEWIRQKHIKLDGGKEKQQRQQQQHAPLPLRAVDTKLLCKFLKSDWQTNTMVATTIDEIQLQAINLADLFIQTFNQRANAVSAGMSKSVLNRTSLVPIPDYQIICLKRCASGELLVGQVGYGEQQIVHLLKISDDTETAVYIDSMTVPSGFIVEWADFYGEDHLFCLIRNEEQQQQNQGELNPEQISLTMVMCSFSEAEWTPFTGEQTQFAELTDRITKQRDFIHEGLLQNVHTMDGRIGYAAVVIGLPDENETKRLCTFDLEDSE